MLNKLLQLTRPLFIIDVESTGVDVKQDRIVELAFECWTAVGMIKEYRTLINPGVPIPTAVSKIHGITDVDFLVCRTCGQSLLDHPIDNVTASCTDPWSWPTFKQLAPNLAKGFTNCDFAGKNPRFDLRILAAEMTRASRLWTYAGARIIDADRLEAWLNKRSLSHLYRKYTGQPLENAHGALTDVQASRTVIEAQMQQRTQNEDEAVLLPRDLDALHELQWPGWIDSEGFFQFVDGVACIGRWGKHAGRPMKNVDVGYWDFILKSDFSAEVKTIAGQAKLGKYPEIK